MKSQAQEDYLKALYHLHLKDEEISLTELGESLALSKPTVNDMVKKFHEEGWVVYEKYKPIRLTKEGKIQAAFVVRKHRLSEMFLSQIMGFGWEEVHDIAEELEHVKMAKFFDRMDELLGFPNADPHGSPIPNKDGEVVRINYKTLADCDAGTTVILKALNDSSTELLFFLNKKEIQLGTKIVIHEIESFDQSRIISYRNLSNQILSNKVARKLLVEEI